METQTDPIGAVIDRLCHTREELAQQLGVSPAALYSWSVGRRSPRAANRSELAKIARSHARELADLANLLEGPARRTLDPIPLRSEPMRAEQLADRHQAWRRELKEMQARAVEARQRARETMNEARKVGGVMDRFADRVREDARRR
jgi:hypothetical protein